jgi:two-component system, NtrC family, sensor histidine kinase HydH
MVTSPVNRKHTFLRIAPFVSVAMALLFVSLICIWGWLSDWHNRRQLIYSSEISQARSHAERTVVRIEIELRKGKTLRDFSQQTISPWLEDHWQRTIVNPRGRLFAAIQSSDLQLLAHSKLLATQTRAALGTERPAGSAIALRTTGTPELTNASLPKSRNDLSQEHQPITPWLGIPLSQYGANVYALRDRTLSSDKHSIDVRIPIQFESQTIGFYHTAILRDWLDERVWAAQRNPMLAWMSILLSILLIVIASCVLLFRLGSHARQLEQALHVAEARRLADLSRLIVGMAHELRNPLNAVRLNLFTSEKLIRGESSMPKADAIAMLHESVCEVERVNELIGQLLGYARVRTEDRTWLNVEQEMESILHFMQQIHDHHAVRIEFHTSNPNIEVHFEQKCLRQIMLNLLQNARQAMADGGTIRISVEYLQNQACLMVDDSGPGIQVDQFERIFEPFYSTRLDGVGLGLAVVKNLVEDAGGEVRCQRSISLGGMSFSLRMPGRLALSPIAALA